MNRWLKYIIIFMCLHCAYANTSIELRFTSGIASLMHNYNYKYGLWESATCLQPSSCQANSFNGFWYWAHATNLLVDYVRITGNKSYLPIIFHTTHMIKHTGLAYFDDQGWWTLTFINTYLLTHNKYYLNTAITMVHDIVSRGHQNICYGNHGIYWDNKHTQVGSVANLLLIINTALLYQITNNKSYYQLANNTWRWLQYSGLFDVKNMRLADHYAIVNNKCGNKIATNFTYNDGLLLNAMSHLAVINHDKQLKNAAIKLAKLEMYRYSLGGILTETCTNVSICAEDNFMFKGIFIQQLMLSALNNNNKKFTKLVLKYLQQNYDYIIANNVNSSFYPFSWYYPVNNDKFSAVYNPADLITTMSVLYLMDSILMLEQSNSHYLKLKNIKKLDFKQ
jgi:hypothetical protein